MFKISEHNYKYHLVADEKTTCSKCFLKEKLYSLSEHCPKNQALLGGSDMTPVNNQAHL
jgi:hypothetical protein